MYGKLVHMKANLIILVVNNKKYQTFLIKRNCTGIIINNILARSICLSIFICSICQTTHDQTVYNVVSTNAYKENVKNSLKNTEKHDKIF